MPDSADTAAGEKSTTPDSLSFPEDKRKHAKAGVYPYYNVIYKGRDGATIIGDSSEGAESLTIQGRGGEMIQMTEGSVRITSHNGMYTVVLGENRMYITGSHDITVDGDASWRIKGSHRVTVDGDFEHVVNGEYTMTAKNVNQIIRGRYDTTAKSMNTNIEGSASLTAHGHMGVSGDTGMTLGSTGGHLAMGAKGSIGMVSGSDTSVGAGGKISIKAGGIIGADGSQILLNSGASTEPSINHPRPQTGDF